MIADTPPAITCVTPEEIESIEVVLKGTPEQIGAALDDIRKIEPKLDVAISTTNELESQQAAIIRFSSNDPYRKIGGIIYTAQLRGLDVVTLAQRPPLCSDIKR
jgi:hypothetical protein